MRLSELKPCAACNGKLVRPGVIQWYVLRMSTALVKPQAFNQVAGLTQMFHGALGIAEAMAPDADVVAIIGDDPRSGGWMELHVCFDCYVSKFGLLCGLMESRP